jgi:hypothetical protein
MQRLQMIWNSAESLTTQRPAVDVIKAATLAQLSKLGMRVHTPHTRHTQPPHTATAPVSIGCVAAAGGVRSVCEDLTPIFSFNDKGLWVGSSSKPKGDASSHLSRWRDLLTRMQADGIE